MNFPNLIAHRGASAYAPENTILAFKKAKLLGASMVEFDVVMTKDCVPIVMHDDDVRRTTNGTGRVDVLTFDQIRQLDAGSWFSKKFTNTLVPSFAEALEELSSLNLRANVELKPSPQQCERLVTKVLTEIMLCWRRDVDDLIISSFDTKVLSFVRRLSPSQSVSLLVDKWTDRVINDAIKLGCFSVNISDRLVSEKRLALIKSSGLDIFVYTVNRKSRATKLLAMGVDAFFTDYPDLLI